jgi:hypothetical protein
MEQYASVFAILDQSYRGAPLGKVKAYFQIFDQGESDWELQTH